MINQEILKYLFNYDQDTGLFTRLIKTANNTKIGDIAGSLSGCGYLYISINGKSYCAHVLAYIYVNGKLPKNKIDHINGIRNDNRIINLRDVTHSENLQNQRKPPSSNKLGIMGVKADRGRYVARITINGKLKHIGSFKTQQEASEAYLTEKRIHHLTCTI